jgi:ATP-dependent Clp protease, protease subunit
MTLRKTKNKLNSLKKLDSSFLDDILGGNNDTLYDRGIIFINDDISKETLVEPTKALLEYHFDPEWKDEVQIVINSYGGETDASFAFIDMMNFVRNKIRTIAVGSICSASVDIFIAGQDRIMAPNASAMIHTHSWGVEGKYDDLVSFSKANEMSQKTRLKHYLANSKYETEEEVRQNLLTQLDIWLTPEQMIEHGLADAISKPKAKTTRTKRK